MKMVTRLVTAAAASSLAFAPIAAQAGTRAGDNAATYSVSAPGLGRAAQGESLDDAESIILLLLGTVAFVTGIVLAFTSDDDGQSPGT